MTLSIRPLVPEDRPAWDPLWQGYLVFYEEELPDEITGLSWARFFDEDEPTGAIGAFVDGNLIGFCHHHFHRSTWATTTYCYLEDLFVSPDSRGSGAGRALIEATADLAAEAGAEKLYWHTRTTNATARALYDQVATHVGDIVYERDL
ncbi:MAG: family acetyltransferase [Ilumatobacteraceae bacterium]|nr:family acetyltransferase [Ilumatobacteraceae bacterium]